MTSSHSPMTTRRTQGARSDHTRRVLIAATMDAIADDGYQAATTRRIAEAAGVSLGAVAHHFPARLDLIVAAIDEVGRRAVDDLHAQIATIPVGGKNRTPAALDVMWSYFEGSLFTVWLRVWLAAAEDVELYRGLAPLERGLAAAVVAAAADLAPENLPPRVWNRRFGVVLDTMRGLALSRVEPRTTDTTPDRWPTTRAELTHLLDRPWSNTGLG